MNLSRRITLSVATAVLGFSLMGGASAKGYPSYLEADLVNICEAIQKDNRRALNAAVKKSGVSYRALQRGLVCNGEDMMTFAMTSNAHNASAFLAARLNLDASSLTAKR